MFFVFFIVVAFLFLSLLMGCRNQYWLYFFVAVCMAGLFSFSVNIPDYSAYKSFYDQNGEATLLFVNGDSSSIFFSYYALFLKNMGLNYDMFRLFTFFIVSAITFSLLKDKIEIGLFVCAYAIVPFVFDLVQIRFFLSEVLCFWAIFLLAKGQRLGFIILICMATFVHSMNCLFAFLLLVPLDLKWYSKFFQKPYMVMAFFSTICLFSVPFVTALQSLSAKIMFFNEYKHYLEVSVRYGFVLYIVYQVFNVAFALFTHHRLSQLFVIPLFHKRIDTLNYIVQIVGILFIILAMLNVNFSRYFRIFFILNMLNFSSFVYLQNYFGKNDEAKLEHVSSKITNVVFYTAMLGIWLVGETTANHAYVKIINSVNQFFPAFF